MRTITIRDTSAADRSELETRAAANGQSVEDEAREVFLAGLGRLANGDTRIDVGAGERDEANQVEGPRQPLARAF